MVLPRRGGPAGRCQQWLRLSKKHKELRKLIPIYFPANSLTSTNSEENANSSPVATEHSSGSNHELSSALSPSKTTTLSVKSNDEQHNAAKVSIVWNIDFKATHRLHDMINTELIYQSLNMSPIHWKCMPQLRSLAGKHCAALCGVIIRKKRKKLKRLSTPTKTDEKLSNLNKEADRLSCSPQPSQKISTPSKKSLKNPSKPLPTKKSPDRISISEVPVSHSENNKENIPETQAPIIPEEKEKTPTFCCFCFHEPRSTDKHAHGTCTSCNAFLRNFTRSCRTLDDFVCLRDVQCSERWPVTHASPEIPEELKNNQRFLEHGPFGADWCTPCKVLHCVKLGCKLTDFCGPRSYGFYVLRGFTLDSVASADYRHRVRERRAQSYLDIIKSDFAAFGPVETLLETSSPDAHTNKLSDKQFFDLLWVRPLYLPSYHQLRTSDQEASDSVSDSTAADSATNLENNTLPEIQTGGSDAGDRISPCCQICSLQLPVNHTIPSTRSDRFLRLLQKSTYAISLGPHRLTKRSRPSTQPSNINVIDSIPQTDSHDSSEILISANGTTENPADSTVVSNVAHSPVVSDNLSCVPSDQPMLQTCTNDLSLGKEPMEITDLQSVNAVNGDPETLSLHNPLDNGECHAATPIPDANGCFSTGDQSSQSMDSNINSAQNIVTSDHSQAHTLNASANENDHPVDATDTHVTDVSQRKSSPNPTSEHCSDESAAPPLPRYSESHSNCEALPLPDNDIIQNVLEAEIPSDRVQSPADNRLSPVKTIPAESVSEEHHSCPSHEKVNNHTNPSDHVSICGPCLLHIRLLSSRLIKAVESEYIDPLSALLQTPEKFCTSNNGILCCDALCDNCYLYRCFNFIRANLLYTPDAATSPGGLLLPVGGPLILPTGSAEGNTCKTLFTSCTAPKTLRPDSSDSFICTCCQSASEFLSYYTIGGEYRICSGCLWTFKAALLTAPANPHVSKIARRLASAAETTDSSVPLLSHSNRRILLDMTNLTYLLGNPCSATCPSLSFNATSVVPLWFACPSCAVRRCFRLLPLSLPIHPPPWFRRRLKMFSKSDFLCDLDPRLCWPHTEKAQSNKTKKRKKISSSRKLTITDVDYTNSIIERWLIPPELPGGAQIDDDDDVSSNASSDEDIEGDNIPEESSGYSESSDTFALSDQDSDYGGDSWWERVNASKSNDGRRRSIDQDSSATEPETDATRAAVLVVSPPSISSRRKSSHSESAPEPEKPRVRKLSRDEESSQNQKSSEPKALAEDAPQKCRQDSSDGLIVKGKRQLKLNPRFIDDFDGSMPGFAGPGRRTREESSDSGSQSSRKITTPVTRPPPHQPQKTSSRSMNRHSVEKSSFKESRSMSNDFSDVSSEYSVRSSSGPRVKQTSRPAIKQDEGRYSSTLSAMIHAARLAAVGAKIPGGTSPNHAALAATARTNRFEEPTGNASCSEPLAAPSGGRSLPARCGQCPACCGLIQPCGRCNNCRSLQQPGKTLNAQPCKELTCFRRRSNHSSPRSGPRVKLPSNFSPTRAPQAAQKPSSTSKITNSNSSNPASVSLLDTVPGLAQQLNHGCWVSSSGASSSKGTGDDGSPREYFKSERRQDVLNVYSDVKVTPIAGGDLGMRFLTTDEDDGDEDRIQPLEGEVINTELSHHGGYAVVTTTEAAPPKELCYSCGSGGSQLLFCVSCAEPFHFYCVERQFRPRRKDHFICRNCTTCRMCKQSAADLRCIRCVNGYHPHCLPDYAPANTLQRSNWVCPWCTTCVHCGVRPVERKPEESSSQSSGQPGVNASSCTLIVPWSKEPNKCGACSAAEAKGDLCPECDRAYLPGTQQMVQCDTCQLWMHRSCSKLTEDEYEYIASLPSSQLRKFVVNCTVCQRERQQRNSDEGVPGSPIEDGATRLRAVAREKLTEGMTGLLSACVRSGSRSMDTVTPSTPGSPDYVPIHSPADVSNRIPQLDGIFDHSDPIGLPDPLAHHMNVSQSGSNSPSGGSVMSDFSLRDRGHKSIQPPPIRAEWVMDNESSQVWTTPRFLLYRTLTRILHRLAAFPVSSGQALGLRRLLRWLTSTTESLFPWLNVTELTNDVRDILRQSHGNFEAVIHHFEKCAIIEMHELICPHIAVQLDLILRRSAKSGLEPRPWSSVAKVQQCFSASLQHLRGHHASLLKMKDALPEHLDAFRYVILAKQAVTSAGLSQCGRPHEVEVSERMRLETREERWVEHWTGIEEELVLGKFHRNLQRMYRKLLQESKTTDVPGETDAAASTLEPACTTSESKPDADNLVKDETCGNFYFAPESEKADQEMDSESSSDEDVRRCLLCGGYGESSVEGRLLFTGADTWIHINCALWSNEVYEEESGQLIGLSNAIHRARVTKCADCGKYGATLLCSNAHKPVCTLHNEPMHDEYGSGGHFVPSALPKAVHFACVLRRRPPAPKSIFTADRSWFCSPTCHQSAMRQRLADAIDVWRQHKQHRTDAADVENQESVDLVLNKEDYSTLESSVADDLEPISLGELLVCRRVFVPSDCFAASLIPSRYELSPVMCHLTNSPEVANAMYQAIRNLAVSPNTFAFLRGSGLTASSLVVTVGSLRVDRLGEVREASDALALHKGSSLEKDFKENANFLCPINYRARRIYWSANKLDERVSYTLHVKQMHATHPFVTTAPRQRLAISSSVLPTDTPLDPSPPLLPVDWRSRQSPTVVRSHIPIKPSHSIANATTTAPQSSSTSVHVTSGVTLPPAFKSTPSTSGNPLSNGSAPSISPSPQQTRILSPTSLRIMKPVSLSASNQPPTSPGNIPQSTNQQSVKIVSAVSVFASNRMNFAVSRPLALQHNASEGFPHRPRFPQMISANRMSFVRGVSPPQHIQIMQRMRPTIPTKDVHLANQLNGVLKSVMQPSHVRMNQVSPTPINPCVNGMMGPPASVSIRIRAPRLLPQLDGTVDSDDDFYTPSNKRARMNDVRRRLGSTNNNSSFRQGAIRGTSQPKRRWIEERNKQQELAQLVSKAKLANHARMYQNEVEKYTRSFRLRFAVDGIVRAAGNPTSAWRHVLFRVSTLRDKQGLPSLINSNIDGFVQFGLSHRHVVFLVEQMRGAFHCYRYKFQYHWRKIENIRQKFTPPVPIAEGCARAKPWNKPRQPNHARDPLSFLSCKSNPPPRPLLNSNCPTRDSAHAAEPATLLSPNEQKACAEAAREAAYLVARQLKLPAHVREACIAQAVTQATGLPITSLKSTEDKARLGLDDSGEFDGSFESNAAENEPDEPDFGTHTTQFKRMVSGHMARYLRVSVHPSRIHGRGLFALRGFREDEMIIEYLGELIRNVICECREIRYRAAGVDCYMFRVDPDLVIDATYAGNAARFINHSCEPNCYAKIITVEDKKHIVILAKRRIYPGEELTYDYRFPKESDKLLCKCGSYNCRKYLN